EPPPIELEPPPIELEPPPVEPEPPPVEPEPPPAEAEPPPAALEPPPPPSFVLSRLPHAHNIANAAAHTHRMEEVMPSGGTSPGKSRGEARHRIPSEGRDRHRRRSSSRSASARSWATTRSRSSYVS